VDADVARSGRTAFDRNRTLWASWVVDARRQGADGRQRFYFSGDTAYRAVPKGADEAAVPTCPAFLGASHRHPLERCVLVLALVLVCVCVYVHANAPVRVCICYCPPVCMLMPVCVCVC
jgi:hypothetical protein